MVFYFNYNGEEETRPTRAMVERRAWAAEMEEMEGEEGSAGGGGAAMSSPSRPSMSMSMGRGASGGRGARGEAADEDTDKVDVFNVIWARRLVPDTIVSKLPFFPKASTKGTSDKANLPENWRCRMKGFLFLDWNWRHISNNKLAIQIDPNFDNWLMTKAHPTYASISHQTIIAEFLTYVARIAVSH